MPSGQLGAGKLGDLELGAFSSPPPPPPSPPIFPPPFAAAPPGLLHPTAMMRVRPPAILPPTGGSAVVTIPPAFPLPPFAAAPPGLRHPLNFIRRPFLGDAIRAAATVPPPIIPQVYPPAYRGGPVSGPWSRHQILPGQSVPALVPPPPPPPIIPAEVYPPTYHGGPIIGPWSGSRPVAPTGFPTFQPSGGVPGPDPSPPKKAGTVPRLIPRVVGAGIDERLRRHTDLVADVLNAMASRGEIVRLGDKDYALTVTKVAANSPTVHDDLNAGYAVGTMWLNTTDGIVFMCIGNSADSAVWIMLGSKP